MGKSLKVIFLVGCFLLTGYFKAKAATDTHTRTAIFKHAASVPSSVATLSNITISQGILSPIFSSGFFYADDVAYNTTSVTLSPTTTDSTATITVNGAPVISGQISTSIPLSVGQNNIPIVITAQDGVTVDTYTVTVTEAPSSDASLSNLSASAGALSPAFSSGVFSYTDNVSNGTSSVTLTPSADNNAATITVNGIAVVSGQASADIPINVGQNNISVVVTAQDGVTVDTYTVTVTEAPSSDASLSNLSASAGVLSPAFSSGVFSYTDNVSNGTSSVTLTPSADNNAATITVNGIAVVSGQASADIPINVGQNNISVVVTAQDGVTVDTYTVTVTEAPSSDATLSNLSASAGALSPAFSSGVFSYTDNVSNGTSSVTLTPSADNNAATITVNGIAVVSGQASADIPINVGQNNISVVVTAQDGVTVDTYTVTVTEAPSSDATLSNMSISQGELSPAFASDNTGYTTAVNVAQKPQAVYTMGDSITANGGYQTALDSLLGNLFYFVNFGITSDQTADMYTRFPTVIKASPDYVIVMGGVNDIRTGLPATQVENNLEGMYKAAHNSGIKIIALTVTPFKGNSSWTLGKQATQDSVNRWISTAANVDYVIDTYYGLVDPANPYQMLPLYDSGDHLHPGGAGQKQMAQLIYNGAKIIPNPLVDQTNEANNSVTVTPFADNNNALITVNGQAVNSGSPSAAIPLSVGVNNIVTQVTAQDGTTTNAYSLNITGTPSSDAQLANIYLAPGGLTLSPYFDPNVTMYSASVPYHTPSMTIRATTDDPAATMTINGILTATGQTSAGIIISPGVNTLMIVVTAEDGVTQKTYTVTVGCFKSTNAGLTLLTISTGALTPVFTTATTGYSESVAANVTSALVTPTTSDTTATVTVNGIAVLSGAASGIIAIGPGKNVITVQVTAQDGVTTETYTITIFSGSANASLSNLSLSGGVPLSPAFHYNVFSYTASVSSGISSITLTPASADPTATVTVNGAVVASKTASQAIPLIFGANTITVASSAQNGSSANVYTVTVIRAAASSDASLSDLKLSSGTLSPTFISSSTAYSTSVAGTVGSISITPAANNPAATITVNGTVVSSGTQSGAIVLNPGINTAAVQVTAEDGITTANYTVTIYMGDNNAALSYLTLNGASISPAFHYSTYAYTASVPYITASATLTPTLADANATARVNGATVISGTASAAIPLNVGTNTVNTVVTAQNGLIIASYSVAVTRASPSSDATLLSLKLAGVTLTPAFLGTNNNYTTTVAGTVTSTTVTPAANNSGATISVNGIAVTSGSPSGIIALNTGANIVDIIITAQDGVTTNAYAVTVYKGDNSAALSGLAVNGAAISPAFHANTEVYTASVPYTTTSTTLIPTLADVNATVQVNGAAVASGSATTPIPLNVGTNIITTVATAQNGLTTTTYSTTIIRAAPSSDATLSSLKLAGVTLTAAFSSTTNAYMATVTGAITSTTVTPVANNSSATISANGMVITSGSASGIIPLNTGANTINIMVTAQDGVTTDTYTVTVYKGDNNVALSNLTLSGGTSLSPAFQYATNAYTATVSNTTSYITETPNAADANASITVNGTAVTSKTASGAIPVTFGQTIITTVVTAQNGFSTNTYKISVTRPISSIATLSGLKISTGTLSPVFAAGANNYTTSLAASVNSITLTATTTNAGATVTVNGTTAMSGSASAPVTLTPGVNTIAVIVTAQDGVTIETYNVTAYVGATNAGLSNLSLSGAAALSPAFQYTTYAYAATVSNTMNAISETPYAADPNASITVNGIPVTNKTASGSITLAFGQNIITTVVTAQNGLITNTYTVTITRPISSIATLSALKVSTGSLSPVFAAGTNNYTTSLAATVGSITITPTTANAGATVTVNGTTVSSGSPSPPVSLNPGVNTISAMVTAQDGVTTDTYTLIVYKGTNNAVLSNLALSGGTALSPAFKYTTTAYTASVANTVSGISITPTTADGNATVTVNGSPAMSKAPYGPITLTVGVNTITVTVTAQNGLATDTYTVAVTRPAGGTDGYSTGLSVIDPMVTPLLADDGIMVHKGVSPNGDGIDDILTIDYISSYPDNKLVIMNRNGQLIFEMKGYNNISHVFDGHSNKNGQMQLPGTYFYQLDYIVNGVIKHKTGFLVLKY